MFTATQHHSRWLDHTLVREEISQCKRFAYRVVFSVCVLCNTTAVVVVVCLWLLSEMSNDTTTTTATLLPARLLSGIKFEEIVGKTARRKPCHNYRVHDALCCVLYNVSKRYVVVLCITILSVRFAYARVQ